MTDFELLSIVMLVIGVIVVLIVELIKNKPLCWPRTVIKKRN